MKTLLLSLLLACLPLPAFAQTVPATDTPEAAADALYAAMQRSDWKGAAALFDPAALKEFRGTMAPLLELGADSAQAGALVMLFGGLKPAELEAASDTEFFAAFFGGIVASTGAKLDRQQVLGSVPKATCGTWSRATPRRAWASGSPRWKLSAPARPPMAGACC